MREPEHVAVNRDYWNGKANDWIAAGDRLWDLDEPVWGQWEIPDSTLSLLPEDMKGMRAIELGCGTAYISGWMARRGAAVTGVDISRAQLETAARLAAERQVTIELIESNAESVDRPDASFDFAISEYGAAIWSDPYQWIPEAHRLLVPGGRLVFLGNHIMTSICSPIDGSLPVTERLEQSYFGQYRTDWRDAIDEPGGIEFNLPTGAWIELFRDTGFEILALAEPPAPSTASGVRSAVNADWARRFPCEHVWFLGKASSGRASNARRRRATAE